MQYYLPPHVFFCSSGSFGVFLDLDRDRYLAVEKESIEGLGTWLSGRSSAIPGSASPQEIQAAADSVAGELQALGLLTLVHVNAKSLESVTVPAPRPVALPRQPLLLHALRLTAFFAACHAANHRLTTMSIGDTVRFVRDRKARNRGSVFVRPRTLLSLLSTFKSLRLLYPRPYLCLFDSLALVEFLAMYRIFPTWVFGVRGEPFNAHCWVQHDELLLNDSPSRVVEFTPIMTV